MNCRKTIFSLNIIVILFTLLLPIGPSLIPPHLEVAGADSSPSTSSLSPSGGKGSSEEENIDSFDVHPESLRWNTTLDDSIEDRVDSSFFETLQVENTTDGVSGYEMNRGTVKTDGKFEWRMSSAGSGNQSEYFRDQLGDEIDFTEGDLEDHIGLVDMAAENGILTANMAASVNDRMTGATIDVSTKIYHTVELRIKANVDDLKVLLRPTCSGSASTFSDWIIIGTSWNKIVFNRSDYSTWHTIEQTIDYLGFLFDEEGGDGSLESTDQVEVDYIKLIGDFDFPTHVEGSGGVEDTWDWEDSLEYFYNDYDNISDFNDGSIEEWDGGGTNLDSITNENGWLEVASTAAQTAVEFRTNLTLSVDSSVYREFVMEWNATKSIDSILWLDSGANSIGSDSTGWLADTKYLTSVDFGDDGDWSGTETQIRIQFSWTGADQVDFMFNFTFLYDVELGDLEDHYGLTLEYVNPNGYYSGTCAAGAIDYLGIGSDGTSLEMESGVFHTFVIRWRTFANLGNIILYADPNGAGGNIDLGYMTLTKSWSTFEVVLTDDVDWDDNEDYHHFFIGIYDDSGNLEGDEIIQVDYVLLLGNYSSSYSVIGLMDSSGTPLLNISTHFVGNNSARVEFELLDATGSSSYYWYSDWYNDLSDQFIIGKCTFDVLRSRLEITITCENNTRIDKITFPNEFIVASGLTSPLFSNEIAPYIFVSTIVGDHSWSHVFIDWIKADFKEREWIQTYTPSDDNYTLDGWSIAYGNDAMTELSKWQLVVPKLDSFSIKTTVSETTQGLTWSDAFYTDFKLFGVDADDGDLHEIVTVSNGMADAVSYDKVVGTIHADEAIFTYEGVYAANDTPTMYSSFSLSDERSVITVKSRWFPDGRDDQVYYDMVWEGNIADYVDDPCSEFVIQSKFRMYLEPGSDALIMVEDFGLIERDIFTDIGRAVVEPLGNFLTELFAGFFKFIAGIFKGVGDALGVIFVTVGATIIAGLTSLGTTITGAIGNIETWLGTVQTAITGAIGNIETWLGTVQTAITGAIDSIEGWLNTVSAAITAVLDSVVSELQDLASDVATAIWTGISDTLDFITDAIGTIATGIWEAILLIAEDLADLFIEVVDFLITLAGNILSGIWVFLTELLFWFWDEVGFPDLLGLIDTIWVGFVQFVTGLITFIPKLITVVQSIWSLVAVLGIIFILMIPVFGSDSPGEWLEKVLHNFMYDVTLGTSLLGFKSQIPAGAVWMVCVIATVLSGTIFSGFF